MKKIFLVLNSILCFFIGINQILADDLEIVKDGFRGVEENEVQIIYSKMNFQDAIDNNDVTFDGDFAIKTMTQPSSEDIENGTYDARRNESNDYISYSDYASGSLVLVYTQSVPKGEQQLPGSITMKFRNAAIMSDHTYGDVILKIDNITASRTIRATTRPIALLLSVRGNIWLGSYVAKQERSAEQIKNSAAIGRLGLSYDISINVTKPNSDEKINKKMILSFVDIDQADGINSNDTDQIKGYVDSNGQTLPYTESITLISGITENVHLTEDTYLHITDTPYGKNTKFGGTRATSQSGDSRRSGFITRVNSGEFKLNWSGQFCGTKLGIASTAIIATSTTGQYPDKVSITETDDTILWKENKTIEMSAESGYYIDKITIDGVEISYNSLNKDANGKSTYTKSGKTYNFEETNGIVKYTFSSVTGDHEISVSAEKTNTKYKIHYDANGGNGTMEDTIATFDIEGNLSPNTFTKDGYEFVNWTAYVDNGNGELVLLKDNNNNNINYADKDRYLNLYGENKREVTLKANWKKIQTQIITINPPTGDALVRITIALSIISGLFLIFYYEKSIKNN